MSDAVVNVTVSGLTGSGKSAICGEIEIALKAIGVSVLWENGDSEKRLTHADWQGALDLYKPHVVLREENIARAPTPSDPAPAAETQPDLAARVAELEAKLKAAEAREDQAFRTLGISDSNFLRVCGKLADAEARLAAQPDALAGSVGDGALREALEAVAKSIRQLEKRSFILVPAGNGVRAVKDSGGAWLNKFEVFDVLEAAIERAAYSHPPATGAVPGEPAPSVDDYGVDRFALAMKAKLYEAWTRGHHGWDDKTACTEADLSRMLREHVEKGDPVDVANFAMMLHQRGERIVLLPAGTDGDKS